MTKKTVTSLALAAGCALILAAPAAQAQVHSEWSGSPILNNKESREYMRLLQTNWSFRQNRIGKECGPVTDSQLYQNCVASFDVYTPFVGSTRLAGNEWYPPNPQTYSEPSSLRAGIGDTTMGMTGSTMPTTGTTGGTGHYMGYGGTMTGGTSYSAGADPARWGPYTTTPVPGQEASWRWYQARNYPGQGTSVPPAGAMPFYPGPRPSGPLSNGGAGQ